MEYNEKYEQFHCEIRGRPGPQGYVQHAQFCYFKRLSPVRENFQNGDTPNIIHDGRGTLIFDENTTPKMKPWATIIIAAYITTKIP